MMRQQYNPEIDEMEFTFSTSDLYEHDVDVKVKFGLKIVQEFRKLLEPLDDYAIDGGKFIGLKLGDYFDDIVMQLTEQKEGKGEI